MSQSGAFASTFNMGSTGLSGTRAFTGDRAECGDFTLAAGFDGLIDTGIGVDNMPTGHGLLAADIVDVHWDDTDGLHNCRRGLTIDVANANDVTFDETPPGEGDALPANDFAVVITKQVSITTWSIIGDNIQVIAAASDVKCVFDIRENASNSDQVAKLIAGGIWGWEPFNGYTNPFAGITITVIRCSNATTIDGRLTVAALHDLS